MTAYPLQSVLDLRRREEEAATARLARAMRALKDAQEEEAGCVAAVKRTRESMITGSAVLQTEVSSGAEALVAAHFADRRRDEWKAAEARLATFRREVLGAARATEAAARAAGLAARRAREALEKHAARHAAAAQLRLNRREEDLLEEIVTGAGIRGAKGQGQP